MAVRDPLRIWRLLKKATLAGNVMWQRHRLDVDLFEATVAGKHAHVKFLRFDRTDGTMSDRAAVEVSALDTQADDFAVGTEGFEIIASMVAACDPSWSEARKRGEKFRREAERTLADLLRTKPAKSALRGSTTTKRAARRRRT